MAGPLKLTRDMTCRRLLALRFIRDYARYWGEGPSLGEIAGALGISRVHALRIRDRLAAEGAIILPPGRRSIELPEERDRALDRLRRLGWVIDADARRLIPPARPVPPVLDHEEEDDRPDWPERDRAAGDARDHPAGEQADRRRAA